MSQRKSHLINALLCPLKRTSNFFFLYSFFILSFPLQCWSLYSWVFNFLFYFPMYLLLSFMFSLQISSFLLFFFACHFPNCPHVLTFSLPWEVLLSILFSYWSYSVFPPSSCLSSFSSIPFSHNSQFPHLFLHFLPLTKFLQSQLCGSNPFHLYQHI